MPRSWLIVVALALGILGSILGIYKRKSLSEIASPQVSTYQKIQQEPPKETVYVVKEGDSLWSISQKFGVSLGEIAKLNNISLSKILQIGDELRIPLKSQDSSTSKESRKQTPSTQGGGRVYRVKAGDSLWLIARRFGVKAEDIAKANGISLEKKLQIGENLLIPSSSSKQAIQIIASQKAMTSKTSPKKGILYSVRKGDSLWTIAKKYGVSAENIAKANNISLNKTLQIGEKLIIPSKGGEKQVAGSIRKSTLRVVREGVFLRKGPGTGYTPIAKLFKGTQVKSLGQQGDWQKVILADGKTGWIRRDMLGLSLAQKPNPSPAIKGNNHRGGNGGSSSVVKTALSYQGARYAYGGLSSRGFDCSGFVKYVYQKHGLNLPHSASAQFGYGKPVSKEELKPGDLVFFRTGRSRGINHVGIYIGNGKFIHASSARGRVRIDSLNEGYYKARYAGARRLK